MTTNIEKGLIGENTINNELKNIDIYKKIVRNIKIPTEKTDTEIDLILITMSGIFVIESKNYYGIISRSKNDKWYQIFKNKIKYRYSPIRQNDHHIKYLTNYLHLSEDYFNSYIIFNEKNNITNNCYIKNEKLKVLKSNQLFKEVIYDIKQLPIVLSHEEIDKIYIELKYMNI